jgi:hypothetical protein
MKRVALQGKTGLQAESDLIRHTRQSKKPKVISDANGKAD